MECYIEWRDCYSVADATLDGQHKCLLRLVNKLYGAMQEGSAAAAKREVLEELIRYVATHFACEEKAMAAAGFPGIEAHRLMHDALTQRTLGLREQISRLRAHDVLCLLKEWWLGHIQGQDKKYAPYLTGRQPADPPRETASYSVPRELAPGR